jgi:predicted PurR-regulated permease PerM
MLSAEWHILAWEGTLKAEDRFYPRVFGLAVAALLGYALYRILTPFIAPILWALLLAFLLHPVNVRLRGRLRGKRRRGVAAFLMTVIVTLAIILPASLIALAFAGQAADLMDRLTTLAQRYRIARPSDVIRLPVVDRVVHWLADNTPITVDQVQEWIVNGLRTVLQFALANSKVVFLGALGAAVGLLLMLFVLYFLFRDGDEAVKRGMILVPLDEHRKRRLQSHIGDVTRAVVYGNVMTAVVQGALIGIAFWISPLPSPVVFGVLGAVFSLIPAVGTGLVMIPGTIALAVQGQWGWTIFMIAWAVGVVGLADNFLRPIFISGRAQISTLPVFIGAVGGVTAFGPIGLFLGPIVIALVIALVRFAEEARAHAATPALAASDRAPGRS